MMYRKNGVGQQTVVIYANSTKAFNKINNNINNTDNINIKWIINYFKKELT